MSYNPLLGANKLKSWSITANGAAAASNELNHRQAMELVAFGTWGGGTLTIETSPDGGTTWIALETIDGIPATLTSNGSVGGIVMAQGDLLRPVLAGATSPSLTVLLREVVGG